jgi:hypothetical protein
VRRSGRVHESTAAQLQPQGLRGERLARSFASAREQHYFEVPLPVAEYDDTPEGLT